MTKLILVSAETSQVLVNQTVMMPSSGLTQSFQSTAEEIMHLFCKH